MADLGTASAGEQPFMVSSLPLVFCDGRPIAVENMTDRNLVRFVRFMLKCALGVPESHLRTVRRPPWWPRTVPYFNLKASREVEKGHAERLRELIRSCYRGCECDYLLRFCADLEPHCRSGRMVFKNNFDGSSSLYELATNRLVVTCRNENLEYDRQVSTPLSPRRHLLPRLSRASSCSSQTSQLAMVQPPPADIYLCDTCNAEFSSVQQVKAHERECCPPADLGGDSDAESVCSEPGVQALDQTRFLSYIGLAPADSSGKQPYSSPSKHHRGGGAGRLRRGVGLLARYPTVDLASPLGRRLGAGSEPPEKDRPDPDRYCHENKRLPRYPAFPVTWRRPRVGRKYVYPWSHRYCFTAPQRAERRRIVRTGLTDRSRRLLSTLLPCSIKMVRVSAEFIAQATRPRTPPPKIPEVAAWRPPGSVQGLLFRPAPQTAPGRPVRVPPLQGGSPGAAGSQGALRSFRRQGVVIPPGITVTVAGEGGAGAVFGLPWGAQGGQGPSVGRGMATVGPRAPFRARRGRPRSVTSAAQGVFVNRTFGSVPADRSLHVERIPKTTPSPRGTTRGRPRGSASTFAAKPFRAAAPSKPANSEAVVIDLCSSSEDEGDSPAPAPALPLPRVKTEPSVAAPAEATNGDSHQPKNAHSHWSRSSGGSANGGDRAPSPNPGWMTGGGEDAVDMDPLVPLEADPVVPLDQWSPAGAVVAAS